MLLGAKKAQRSAQTLASLDVLVRGFAPLSFDAGAAVAYGPIRAALERKGKVIGPLGMLIAAQAVSAGLVLVRDNLREFRRVPSLQCEHWMR